MAPHKGPIEQDMDFWLRQLEFRLITDEHVFSNSRGNLKHYLTDYFTVIFVDMDGKGWIELITHCVTDTDP